MPDASSETVVLIDKSQALFGQPESFVDLSPTASRATAQFLPPYARVVDSVSTFQWSGPGQPLRYRPLAIGTMSPDELLAALTARNRYKEELLADAIAALSQDPTLPDVDVCKSMEQLNTGECLADAIVLASVHPTASIGFVTTDKKRPPEMMSSADGTRPHDTAPPPPPASPMVRAEPEATVASISPSTRPPVFMLPKVEAMPAFSGLLTERKVTAAALPQIERKFAVLIGIDRYDDARMPQLDNSVQDVRAISTLLESTLGYQTLVLENATKLQMVATLNRLAAVLSPRDSVVIYYAGHGTLVPATGLGYWLPADADPKNPKTWISNADIGRIMTALSASQVALISDSCYSGSLVPDERIRSSTGRVDPDTFLRRKAAVVMSSGGNEPVFDSGKNGHSPFAWNLLHFLGQVSNWQPGQSVFEHVRFAVARELPQRPQYGGAISSGYETGSDYLFERRQLDEAR